MHKLSALLLLAPALAGCAALTGRAPTPDEFAVARNAPLIVPPDYGLAPPVAGTTVVSPTDAQQQAIDALFGGPAPRSSTESSLLERAGRERAAMGARSVVGSPETTIIDKGAVTAAILGAPVMDGREVTAQVPQ